MAESVSARIESFITYLVSSVRVVPPNEPPFEVSVPNLGQFTLTQDEASQYHELLRQMRDEAAIEEDFPESKRCDLLDTAILQAVLPHPQQPSLPFRHRLRLAMMSLSKSLNEPPQTWQIYFPVANVSKRGLPFTFGKVRFRGAGRRLVTDLLIRHHALMVESPNSPDQRTFYSNWFCGDLNERVVGKVVAEIEVKAATSEGARAEALRELKLTLDVLNFYANRLQYAGSVAFAYLPGEADPTSIYSVIFEKSNQRAHYEDSMAGPRSKWSFSLVSPAIDDRDGFHRVSALLSRPRARLTTLEQRILAALRWSGRATVLTLINAGQRLERLREEPFLFYAIALESLLASTGERVGVTQRLSLRCALILSHHDHYQGVDIERLRQRMRDLYQIRSDVVHNGLAEIKEAELGEIARYAKDATLTVLLNPLFEAMSNEAEFERWCNERGEIHKFSLQLRAFSPAHLVHSEETLSTVQDERAALLRDAAAAIQNRVQDTLTNLATALSRLP